VTSAAIGRMAALRRKASQITSDTVASGSG
jgi:hypothetical protein